MKIFPIIIFLLTLSCFFSGCTSTNRSISRADIDYFEEIALGFEDGGLPEVVYKYPNETIKIHICGVSDDQSNATLKRVISDFNGISERTKLLLIDDNDSNIQICFAYYNDFDKYIGGYNKQDKGYFIELPPINQGQLHHGVIVIDNSTKSSTRRPHLIREELTQSLGFGKDSRKESPYKDSIFYYHGNPVISELSTYSLMDEKLIRMLYNTNISTNSNRDEVEVYFTRNPSL